jgi:hypothetical protein
MLILSWNVVLTSPEGCTTSWRNEQSQYFTFNVINWSAPSEPRNLTNYVYNNDNNNNNHNNNNNKNTNKQKLKLKETRVWLVTILLFLYLVGCDMHHHRRDRQQQITWYFEANIVTNSNWVTVLDKHVLFC